MNDLEIRLEAEYESALDAEAPPCAVDVDLARARGRTLRLRRRTAVTGFGLMAAGLAALIVIGALPGTGLGHGSADTAPDANYSGESYPPADDPLATRVTFGWLPDAVAVAGATTQTPDIGTVTAGGAGMRFTASVLPRGQRWAANCSTTVAVPATHTDKDGLVWVGGVGAMACDPPAMKVNGRTAYWVIEPGNPTAQFGGVDLRWQYADDAWADLDAAVPASMAPAAVADLMHKIAENVHVSRFQALPMPFRLSKVPAGWHFDFADWIDGPQGRQASAGGDGSPDAYLSIGFDTTHSDGGEVQVWENPATAVFPTAAELKSLAGSASPPQAQTLSVDGHQARMLTDSNHKALIVHGVNGLDVVVDAIGPAGFSLVGSVGGIIGYYHTITIFGADRATWTTHVLG